MSKYTTELRYIYEAERIKPPEDTELSLLRILENYPLENESFIDPLRKDNKTRRAVLNEKIISRYYFREIGFEHKNRFLFHLQRKLNEIMTLYNQKYKSIDLDVDILANTDLTETFTHTVEGGGKTTANGTSQNSGTNTSQNEGFTVGSDTPPTELTEADIKANKYASNTSHSVNTSSETLGAKVDNNSVVESEDSRTETYTRTEKGSSKGGGTYAKNLEEWRSIMINIDEEILEELNSLFMQIW